MKVDFVLPGDDEVVNFGQEEVEKRTNQPCFKWIESKIQSLEGKIPFGFLETYFFEVGKRYQLQWWSHQHQIEGIRIGILGIWSGETTRIISHRDFLWMVN